MHVLVVGGTRFVGRHVVEAALARGHRVTLFNRGRSAPGLFGTAVEELRGDRAAGRVGALGGRRFDATIDVSGYRPEEVAAVLAALGPGAGAYAFVSTVSVYREPVARDSDEDAPVDESGAGYGGRKVRCERALPPGALVVRPGVVAGPYDPTERVTRWARRAVDGDAVLAADPDQPVQLIDARDLAAFVLDGVERGLAGTFNVVTEPVTFRELLAAAGAGDRVAWVGAERLVAVGVALWEELPLAADPVDAGFLTFSSTRARAAGLRTRPLAETLADVRAWDATRPPAERRDPFARERELLPLLA